MLDTFFELTLITYEYIGNRWYKITNVKIAHMRIKESQIYIKTVIQSILSTVEVELRGTYTIPIIITLAILIFFCVGFFENFLE